MDAILDAMRARFTAQQQAGHIKEFHDDEPTSVQQVPAAFVAAQGPEVLQLTVGSPGKIITRWQMDVYYVVPLSDRRAAWRKLAQIAPLLIADWLRNRRLGGVARDMQVGQSQGRGQFVTVDIGQTTYRALLLPLFIEIEEGI